MNVEDDNLHFMYSQAGDKNFDTLNSVSSLVLLTNNIPTLSKTIIEFVKELCLSEELVKWLKTLDVGYTFQAEIDICKSVTEHQEMATLLADMQAVRDTLLSLGMEEAGSIKISNSMIEKLAEISNPSLICEQLRAVRMNQHHIIQTLQEIKEGQPSIGVIQLVHRQRCGAYHAYHVSHLREFDITPVSIVVIFYVRHYPLLEEIRVVAHY